MTSELRKRLLTGIIGGIALILLVTFGGWIEILFFSTVISVGMIYEFCEITLRLPDRFEKKYALLLLGWLLALANLLAPNLGAVMIVFSFMILFGYFLLTAKRHNDTQLQIHFKEFALSVLAVIYLIYLPFYLPKIHASPNGVKWTILFLLIVWSGDTGAYFGGKHYGKRKLYVEISPKKTWEGSVAGLATGMIIALFSKLVFFHNLSIWAALFIPVPVGIAAQAGDLCESFLKRAFEKKDSGSIIPGHGGFLDRFDGVVFSLPVMYALVQIFNS